jgi:ankyrin repeat protein
MIALMHAVKNKNSSIVAVLSEVMQKSGLDATDKKNTSSVLYAIKNNDIQTLTVLIKAGANLNVKDEFGKTPLIIATDSGNIALVKDLLAAGANTEEKDNTGRSALMHAVQGGYASIVSLLISNKADIETTDLIAATPLILAAKEKNNKIAAELVKSGADVNAQDRLGRTPLIWAMNNNDYPTFNALLSSPELKVDFIYGEDAQTPLMSAVKEKNYRMAAQLIRRGANVNVKDKFDKPTVVYALEKDDYPLLNAIVSSPSFTPNLFYGEDRSTPLIAAVRAQNYKAVATLLNKGADVNQQDIFKNAPLHYALQNNDTKIVDLLTKNAAAKEHGGFTQSRYTIEELDKIIAELQKQLDEAKREREKLEKAKIN